MMRSSLILVCRLQWLVPGNGLVTTHSATMTDADQFAIELKKAIDEYSDQSYHRWCWIFCTGLGFPWPETCQQHKSDHKNNIHQSSIAPKSVCTYCLYIIILNCVNVLKCSCNILTLLNFCGLHTYHNYWDDESLSNSVVSCWRGACPMTTLGM